MSRFSETGTCFLLARTQIDIDFTSLLNSHIMENKSSLSNSHIGKGERVNKLAFLTCYHIFYQRDQKASFL